MCVDRKRMTVLLNTKPNGLAYTKGASEVVLGLCDMYTDK
jgi:magnesium-transporting ATPase (P-type)